METTVGIERERFIVNQGKIAPLIGSLLPTIQKIAQERRIPLRQFDYELFAGQIEDRTPPCESLDKLREALIINDGVLEQAAIQHGLDFDFTEFVEDLQMKDLVVNPFDERHSEIWRTISSEQRLAASRVAAVHVHIATTATQAVSLINLCDKNTIAHLSEIGDHSNGKRIAAYRIMTQSKSIPPRFVDVDELLRYIEKHNGERNVWDLVRYKPSTQTTEFRMFGTTEDIEEIVGYVEICLSLFGRSLSKKK